MDYIRIISVVCPPFSDISLENETDHIGALLMGVMKVRLRLKSLDLGSDCYVEVEFSFNNFEPPSMDRQLTFTPVGLPHTAWLTYKSQLSDEMTAAIHDMPSLTAFAQGGWETVWGRLEKFWSEAMVS